MRKSDYRYFTPTDEIQNAIEFIQHDTDWCVSTIIRLRKQIESSRKQNKRVNVFYFEILDAAYETLIRKCAEVRAMMEEERIERDAARKNTRRKR